MKVTLFSVIIILFAYGLMPANEDIKIIKFYDSKTYFEGQVLSAIAYDHHKDMVYCISVDTKDAYQYHYFVRVLEGGTWQQINTAEYGYPYGDTLRITGVEVDKNSRVWLITADGFLIFENKKWEKIQTEEIEGLEEKTYRAVIPDSLGNVFFQISYGYKFFSGGPVTQIMKENLYRYQPDGNKLIYSCDSANYVDNPERLSGISAGAHCADDKGNIWLASDQNTTPEGSGPTKKGMMRYNDAEGKYEFIEMVNHVRNKYLTGFVPKQLVYTNGSIWLVHDRTIYNNMRGGLTKLNLVNNTWEPIDSLEGMKDYLSALNSLVSIISEGNSIIWGCSKGSGLLKFDLKAQQIKKLSFADLLNRDDIRYKLNEIYNSIKDLDGNNWFVTWAGIIKTEGTKTSVIENVEELVLEIFPNPARDYILTKKNSNLYEPYTITDEIGREVLTGTLTDNIIDIRRLTAGYYNIQIGSNSTASFIKE